MPKGIILTSGSEGATQEDLDKVLAAAGYEAEEPEAVETTTPEAPKREDFESDEDFEDAQAEHEKANPPEAKDQGKKTEEEEEEDEEEGEQKPAKVSKFKRRISRAIEPYKRENEELKRRVEALEKGGKVEDKKAAVEANPRPKRAEFTDDEKYEDALVKWGVADALAKNEKKTEQGKQQETLNTKLKTYQAAVEEFRENLETDDWDEVVGNEDIPMLPSTQLAIIELANAAEVTYYLGRHPEYAKKMSEMSDLAAVMEVGRLSAKLAGKAVSGSARPGAGRSEKPKTRQLAPKPVNPVSSAATSSTLTSKAAAAARNFKAFKQAQRAGR